MVLVAECNEGIGQSTFWDVLSSSKDPMEVMARIDAGYRLGYHKAARIVQLAETSDIYLVGRIPRETLAKGFIRGFPDIGSALTSAIGKTGRSPSILFVPDGTVTVPIPKGGMR